MGGEGERGEDKRRERGGRKKKRERGEGGVRVQGMNTIGEVRRREEGKETRAEGVSSIVIGFWRFCASGI